MVGLNNGELLAGLSALVSRSNELTADVLAHLAELDERRLHLELGFPSLFAYCTESLGLSESAAGRRIAAARVCRKFSQAFERVAHGQLHLSALCALAPHLDPENACELFDACERKSRRQIDELLAARFPKPDLREQIRRLPKPRAVAVPCDRPPASLLDMALVGERKPLEQTDTAGASPTLVDGGCHTVSAANLEAHQQFGARSSGSSSRATRELEPLSADRFGIRFTADREFQHWLDRARALSSHRLPNGDLATLMTLALRAYVQDLEKRRFGIGRKQRDARDRAGTNAATAASVPSALPLGGSLPENVPRRSGASEPEPSCAETSPDESPPDGSPPDEAAIDADAAHSIGSSFAKRGRHVPAAVAREVYARDGAQCSFVSNDGRRCAARSWLELDHVLPWAEGGPTESWNLRLRCRAHNQQHARNHFGRDHVATAIARARQRKQKTVRPGPI